MSLEQPADAELEHQAHDGHEQGDGVYGGGDEVPGVEQVPVPGSWYTAFVFPHQPQPLYRVTQEYAGYAATCPNSNFLKGVKWSPDGACLLTASDDNCYRGYNDADEPTAAYSLAFSPDGSRLMAGYDRKIYVFDVSRPGREYKSLVTYKRKQPEGIAGIVSCMAFSPAGDLFAAGTYTGALGVYDARTYELALLLSGNRGGLTQASYSGPCIVEC
ncbi:hypothetical protein GPECTOR_1g176 [Gonium pectorale]|uniref:Anaphase-promoting complex subunit 4 WD40 domain-containing protein n=1 Tax=Gonium pectorale TaxID=33097 RepID=A0A150H2I2_GONPE|nr:hypothetical protein GPECTOR_1g176 [Gonium pectorale]|eukprot:KXZ56203.1 hypothetical protein GPECTOR_1g176 [Gonium pectorale]